MSEKKYVGTCHCGAVRFEVELAPDARVSRCNCTICRRTGVAGTMVKPSAFRLLAGEEALSSYEWGGRIAKRFFCKSCGVQCFAPGHLAELGGDYVSVNVNCIDDLEIDEAKVVYWDGRHNNWQAGPRNHPWPVHASAS
jgi:hypothetical protein